MKPTILTLPWHRCQGAKVAPRPPAPPPRDLSAELAALTENNAALGRENAELRTRLVEIEARLQVALETPKRRGA